MEWTRETTNSERVNNRTLLFILFNSSSVLSECSTKESALSAGVPSVLNNKFSFAGFYLMNGIRNGSLMAYEMEIGTASEMVQTRLLNKLAIRWLSVFYCNMVTSCSISYKGFFTSIRKSLSLALFTEDYRKAGISSRNISYISLKICLFIGSNPYPRFHSKLGNWIRRVLSKKVANLIEQAELCPTTWTNQLFWCNSSHYFRKKPSG